MITRANFFINCLSGTNLVGREGFTSQSIAKIKKMVTESLDGDDGPAIIPPSYRAEVNNRTGDVYLHFNDGSKVVINDKGVSVYGEH